MRGYGQGATYEVSGPFRGNGPSAAPLVFGATPAQKPGDEPAQEPAKEPAVRLRAPRRMGLPRLLRRGVKVRVEITQPGTVSLALRTGEVLASRKRGRTAPEPRQFLVARASRRLTGPGTYTVRLRPKRNARRKMLRAHRASRVMLTAQLTTQDGRVDVASRPLRLVKG